MHKKEGVVWTEERTNEQIERVSSDIVHLNKEMNKIDGKIAELQYCKKVYKKRISKLDIYKGQLLNQLKSNHEERENVSV